MMSLVNINWHPSKKELRKFGIVVIIGMGLISLLFYLVIGNSQVAYIVGGIGAVIGFLGLTGTRLGVPGYQLWMALAFVLGNIMGRILLSIIYYLLFTPTGLARRLLGHDTLALRRFDSETYWMDIPSEGEATRYERQF